MKFDCKTKRIAFVVHDYNAWYQNGLAHRLSGPAVIYSNGDEYWYRSGFLHRFDGPAIIYANGYKCWYEDGVRVKG